MLLVVFMLFRPDFFLDQWQDKYTEFNGPAVISAVESVPVGTDVRLVVSAPDFDTAIVGTTTIVVTPEAEASGIDRLGAVGLSVMEDDDMLLLDEPFPGTPFFESLGNEYDFYGDDPAQIVLAQVENDRMPKEIFFIPALLLLLMIVGLQSRRMTQAPF